MTGAIVRINKSRNEPRMRYLRSLRTGGPYMPIITSKNEAKREKYGEIEF
jgi:hypothetical protein